MSEADAVPAGTTRDAAPGTPPATDRLAEMFNRTRAEGRPALIGFLPGAWPEPGATAGLLRAAVEGGADALEVGLPFSDPLADGATNQAAYHEALLAGATTAVVLDEVRAARAAGVAVPLLLMGYCNPIFAYGVERFVADAQRAGVDGLVIVDLPPEEAGALEAAARAAGLHMVYLVPPTATEERLRILTDHCSGFLYCVSVTGVTGARQQVAADLPEFLERVRRHTSLPLAVGFGISRSEHVQEVGRLAEGAIVGSAIVQTVAESPPAEREARLRAFLRTLRGDEPGADGGAVDGADDGEATR